MQRTSRFLMAALSAASAAMALVAPPARADVTSSFDSGLDGWTAQGGTLSHHAGGWLLQSDTQSTWMSVLAPAAFRGNLTSYLGGTLSFDALNANGAAADLGSAPWFGRVTITGPGGTASRDVAGSGAGSPPPDGLWHSYSAGLDPLLWSGNLTGALGNVTSLRVTLEFNDEIVEVAGFDNFALTAPVPEPANALLLVAGLTLLGVRRWQQRREA